MLARNSTLSMKFKCFILALEQSVGVFVNRGVRATNNVYVDCISLAGQERLV